MNVFGKTFGLLLGLALIGALGMGAWLALDYVGSLFAGLDAQVARVTAIGSAVVLAASALIASAVRRAAARSRTERIHEQKVAAYQFFVECWQNEGTAPHALRALERQLALYGGAAVIRAHAALRAIAREKGARHPDAQSQLGKALLEIRRDLGSDADVRGISAPELEQLVLAHAGSGQR
jgi:hypothetical protein